MRKCRDIKINPHIHLEGYEYSIWIDGNIEINGDIEEVISTVKIEFEKKNSSLMTFKHPLRDCIYLESDECIKQKKDSEEVILSQINSYKNEGFPENVGLVESNVIIRKHGDSRLNKAMDDWWNEVLNKSRRDQLSFNYVMWKNSYKYLTMKGNSRDGETIFSLSKHKLTWSDLPKFIKNKVKYLVRN